jgi:hypothetical protein
VPKKNKDETRGFETKKHTTSPANQGKKKDIDSGISDKKTKTNAK